MQQHAHARQGYRFEQTQIVPDARRSRSQSSKHIDRKHLGRPPGGCVRVPGKPRPVGDCAMRCREHVRLSIFPQPGSLSNSMPSTRLAIRRPSCRVAASRTKAPDCLDDIWPGPALRRISSIISAKNADIALVVAESMACLSMRLMPSRTSAGTSALFPPRWPTSAGGRGA